MITPTKTLPNGSSKCGSLRSDMTVEEITAKLGFAPNTNPSGDGKVTIEWCWRDNGAHFGIWDYKGSRWSFYGPALYFQALFGAENVVAPSDKLGFPPSVKVHALPAPNMIRRRR